MKILVIGGHGTIGKKIVGYFSKEHEVIVAGRSQGDLIIDIGDTQSIIDGLQKIGKLDAIICAAGEAKWAPFDSLTEEDYHIGINSKLMGQVNLTRIGLDHVRPGGSITLTTGILADDPVLQTASAAMVNGGIHSFVQAAALELKEGKRLNAVSTGVVQDAYAKYRKLFPGHIPIAMDKMIQGYIRSAEGTANGQVIRIYD